MDSRYPIGPFDYVDVRDCSPEARGTRIRDIASLPAELKQAIAGAWPDEYSARYRPGGWTLCQVVHHIADSHLNGYARFRLALTEANPIIKAYDEAAWAELPDATDAAVDDSVHLITALHARWTRLLTALAPADFARTFYHPGAGLIISLDQALGMYAWHGRHHVAHVRAARARRMS